MKDVKERDNAPFDIDIQKVKNKVNNSICSAKRERTVSFMKSKKKVALIAAATVCVLGITAFAASGIITSWNSSSSGIPEYKSLPSAEQCIEDIGYVPVLIDTFENGYKFNNGSLVNNNLKDENGNSVEKFKSVMFRYEKDGDRVIFSQDKFDSAIERDGEIVATVDNVDIYYSSYTNKLVPPDYELTEEDKKAEANGELVFSYGTPEVEIIKVQSANWVKDGVLYNLMQMDGKLSQEELIQMATEIIE
ncbi:MAG: hypothetical protein IJ304_06230 [Clostridia bacterium]|nr:hypothetical protein [Clostridia bacterium]